jgi:hypothetical protein
VLVPKFGGVKETAKNTGMFTNAKIVEAYIASTIDNYTTAQATIYAGKIEDKFNDAGNQLVNPYTGVEEDANIVVAEGDGYSLGHATVANGDAGIIYVVVDDDSLDVYINGFDAKGEELKATKRTIER